jgi:Ca-activated chloride channel family protein
LLATDGDFNVGITEEGELESFITEKAKSGVFLTVLGFGTGNLQDSKAEILADRGNGNYAYIDSLNEAYKVLVKQMGGTLVTIAKDVKLQVEFNPGRVAAYRLLGYENRALAAQDFRDDKKDAGEIGAGHSVTALYEVVPTGMPPMPGAVELKYQETPPERERLTDSPELLTVNLRYKRPDEDTGREFAVSLMDGERGFSNASDDFRFAASVASFGMVLRHSRHAGDTSLQLIHEWAAGARGPDVDGLRAEFLRLVRSAQGIPGY